MIIRKAIEDDYDQVEKIMKQVHQLHVEMRSDIYKSVETVLPQDRFLSHIHNDEIIVAIRDNQVVGVLIYLTRMITGGPVIDSMAVDEEYRGQGIGHQLFDYIQKVCYEKDYDGIELQVNAMNTSAKKMYESYGFTEKSINMELLKK